MTEKANNQRLDEFFDVGFELAEWEGVPQRSQINSLRLKTPPERCIEAYSEFWEFENNWRLCTRVSDGAAQ